MTGSKPKKRSFTLRNNHGLRHGASHVDIHTRATAGSRASTGLDD
jgi:hypothetical protein